MMSRLVPKLRFKEFSGEWEEKPILDIASMKARIGWQNLRQDEHLATGEYYLITGTDFNDGRIDWQNAKYVEYERYIQDKYIILEEGDILITKDGSIGKLGYVKNIGTKKATLNNGIFRIRIKDENNKFIYYTFLSIQFRKFLQRLSAGSSINHLYQKDFVTYEVIIPKNPKEQERIANCLSSLDSLIEAQNKKVEALKKHKKGLMQQLFPSEGETVPKLRFEGFSGEWEEKRLGDCLDYLQPTKYLVDSTAYDDKYTTPVLTAGKTFILGYTDETHGIFSDNLPVIIFDDFTTATKFVDFPFKAKSSAMKILLAKEENDIKFMYEAMQMIKYQVGNHERHWISKFAILNIAIPKPKEQQKIASCLSSLDSLIEAQNKKVEALKNHKKGLMQQLFVNNEGQT